MGLKKATATDTVVLLGATPVNEYPAGQIVNGPAFPAGETRKICVALADESEFYVMKLKTEACRASKDLLKATKRGGALEVEYMETTFDRKTELICVAVRPASPVRG